MSDALDDEEARKRALAEQEAQRQQAIKEELAKKAALAKAELLASDAITQKNAHEKENDQREQDKQDAIRKQGSQREQALKEQATNEQTARQGQQTREEAARKDQLAKDDATRKEQLAKEEAARKDQFAREDAAKKELFARDEAAKKDQLAKDDAARKEHDEAAKQQMAEIRRGVRGQMDTRNDVPSVIYSDPYDKTTEQTVYENYGLNTNHQRAELFAKAHGANIIDNTVPGQKLDHLYGDMIQQYGPVEGRDRADAIQRLTSREYATAISGEVKTFVAGAGNERIARADELPTILEGNRISNFNGSLDGQQARASYNQERIEHRADQSGVKDAPRTYDAIVRTELNQDMGQAMQTGNRALIRDAVGRDMVHQIVANNGDSQVQQAAQNPQDVIARIEARTDQLAAESQEKIRAEAQQRINTLVAQETGDKNLTAEQANQIRARLEGKLEDPQQAYKVNTGLQLRELRQEAIDGGSYAKKNDYLETRDDYIKNSRMVKAVEGTLPNEAPGEYAAQRHAADIRAERYIHAEVRAAKDVLNGHMTQDEAQKEIRQSKDEAAQAAERYAHTQVASQTIGQNGNSQRFYRRPISDGFPLHQQFRHYHFDRPGRSLDRFAAMRLG